CADLGQRSGGRLGINQILDLRNRSSDRAIDHRLAIGRDRVDEILDERQVNVRGRGMRFAPMFVAGPNGYDAAIQWRSPDRPTRAEHVECILWLGCGMGNGERGERAIGELKQRRRRVLDLPLEYGISENARHLSDGPEQV